MTGGYDSAIAEGWEPYPGAARAGIRGTLLMSRDALPSPVLPRQKRRLLAWLPPSYGSGGHRFRVVYMHDGHNLFDEAASYAGSWRIDLAMEELAGDGFEAMVIGIPNAGELRHQEYSPWADPVYGGGLGAEYLAFVVDTVKPFVDGSLETMQGRDGAGLAGSSLGGNISLYGLLSRPDIFGFAAALSPAFWFAESAWERFLAGADHSVARIYLDVGGAEIVDDPALSASFVRSTDAVAAQLTRIGFSRDELLVIHEPTGIHHESAWRVRIGDALRFVLGGTPQNSPVSSTS